MGRWLLSNARRLGSSSKLVYIDTTDRYVTMHASCSVVGNETMKTCHLVEHTVTISTIYTFLFYGCNYLSQQLETSNPRKYTWDKNANSQIPYLILSRE